ncbi:hypothetical protein M501DRAFT_1003789 [Patellaria atrata CBS 101060]|uniref:Uncharacterized protein n=1 Tax=Patellaria atrata CBS 101060 TaxID=1346257 RepID=A0A9P4SAV5_9PEZI|nr:hypothetical protein M501DRAFT_1003789 [Patellaria atrata CBS 101060]
MHRRPRDSRRRDHPEDRQPNVGQVLRQRAPVTFSANQMQEVYSPWGQQVPQTPCTSQQHHDTNADPQSSSSGYFPPDFAPPPQLGNGMPPPVAQGFAHAPPQEPDGRHSLVPPPRQLHLAERWPERQSQVGPIPYTGAYGHNSKSRTQSEAP